MYRRRLLRRPRRKYLRRRGVKKGKVSKGVRRYVRRAIHTQLENKQYVSYGYNQTVYGTPAANNPPGMIASLYPQISQGTGDARIANKINLRRGVFKYTVQFAPYDLTNNPKRQLLVNVMLVRCKNSINGAAISSVPGQDWNAFFRAGGSAVPFQGTPLDSILPVNDSYWTVIYRRTHKLGAYLSGDVISGGTVPLNYNDFKFEEMGGCLISNRKIKNKLIYDDTFDTYPKNDNLMLIAWCTPTDSNGTYTSTMTGARISYSCDWKYEDA